MEMVMKKFISKLVIPAVIVSGTTFAIEVPCEKQAELFNSKMIDRKTKTLTMACVDAALGKGIMSASTTRSPASISMETNPHMADIKSNIGLGTFANKNYFVVKTDEENKIYAGSKTGIVEAESVSLSHTGEYVAVLNKEENSKNIRIFKTSYSGNVRPVRVIEGDELLNVNFISYDSNGDQILLHDSLAKKVMTVNSEKDSRKANEMYHPTFRDVYTFNDKSDAGFMKSYDGNVLVLSGNVLSSYSEDFKTQNWIVNLGVIGMDRPKGFQISKNGEEIEIYTQANKLDVILFPKK